MGRIRQLIPVLLVLVGLTCAGCAGASADRFETASFAESAPAMASEDSSAEQQEADGAVEMRQIIANANISLVVKETETAMAASSRSRQIWAGICLMSNFPKGGMNRRKSCAAR